MRFLRLMQWGGVLAVALLAACAPAVYTDAQLAARGAKEVSGVVVKQSRGSFVLRTDDGREATYRTGEMTQYLPVEFRSQEADRVRVAYRDVLERSGRTKFEVLQLEALEIAERNRQLPNPIVGPIVLLGPGSMKYSRLIAVRYAEGAEPLSIFIPIDFAATFEGGKQVTIDDWDKLVGREVAVTAERVPILRGNAMHYVAKRLDLHKAH